MSRKWLNKLSYEIHKVCNRRRSESFYARVTSRARLDFGREALYRSVINNPPTFVFPRDATAILEEGAADITYMSSILPFKDPLRDAESVAQRTRGFSVTPRLLLTYFSIYFCSRAKVKYMCSRIKNVCA